MMAAAAATTTMMATMRQLEERQVENEIRMMEWSPKMDIIAVGFVNGDVSLYRLNWQKLWTASSGGGGGGALCLSFAWRPDGKVLAVGYDDGEMRLMDIESSVPIHSRKFEESVSCLSWIQCHNDSNGVDDEPDDADKDWDFLTRFPSLSKAYSYNPAPSGGGGGCGGDNGGETDSCQKMDDGGMTSLLLCGTGKGKVSVCVNGFLCCVNLRLGDVIGGGGGGTVDVVSIALSDDLGMLSVLCSTSSGSMELAVLSVPLLSACLDELSTVSKRFSALDGMTSYMDDTLKQIGEAWEGILVEMDAKLASYASKLEGDGDCGMAADFLELLMFGTPSPELETFLLQQLTEKGLKKLGGSIEVSYSNVQRLVLKYLHVVSQSVNYHLSELLGLVRANDKYSLMLGIVAEKVMEAQTRAASFWIKGIELQQVIDESMKSFKAFFRWLYVEILRLSDEDIGEELSKMSQQDVRYIAEFLDSFAGQEEEEEEEGGDGRHRNLERVGQYMQDKELTSPVDRSKNPWHRFVQKNRSDVDDVAFVVKMNETKSLVQEFNVLRDAVAAIFRSVQRDMTDECVLRGQLSFPAVPAQLKCGQVGGNKIYGFVNVVDGDDDGLLVVYELDSTAAGRQNYCSVKGLCLSFDKPTLQQQQQKVRHASSASSCSTSAGGGGGGGRRMKLIDCRFYNSDVLSLLVQDVVEENDAAIQVHQQRMIQMSVSDVDPHFKSVPCFSSFSRGCAMKTVSVFNAAGQACHRELERISSVQFAVSGPRKVAAFLFRNKKRVRIYDMEIDEEEEEECEDDLDEENEIMGNSGLSSSELNTSV